MNRYTTTLMAIATSVIANPPYAAATPQMGDYLDFGDRRFEIPITPPEGFFE